MPLEPFTMFFVTKNRKRRTATRHIWLLNVIFNVVHVFFLLLLLLLGIFLFCNVRLVKLARLY